ncbi:MAG: hypothetical protein ACLTMR_12495, partial [Faecalibacillus sp.]
MNVSKKIEKNTKKINDNVFEIDRLSDLLKQEELEKEQKDIELRNANRQLDQMDGTKAIQDEKDKLSQLKDKAALYKEKIDALDV